MSSYDSSRLLVIALNTFHSWVFFSFVNALHASISSWPSSIEFSSVSPRAAKSDEMAAKVLHSPPLSFLSKGLFAPELRLFGLL